MEAERAPTANQLYGTCRSHSPLDTSWEGTITDGGGRGTHKDSCKLPLGKQDLTKAILRTAPS